MSTLLKRAGIPLVLLAGLALAACGADEVEVPEREPDQAESESESDQAESESESEAELASDASESEPNDEAGQVLIAQGGLALTPEVSLVTESGGCIPLTSSGDLNGRLIDLSDAQVVITDASGSIVATTEIDRAVVDDACMWSFETEIPAGGNFYQATAGGFSSGVVSESDAEDGYLVFELGAHD